MRCPDRILIRLLAAGLLLALAGAAPLWPPVRAQESAGEEDEEPQGPVIPLARRFRPDYEGRVYLLKVNLHQPARGGQPAPWIDEKGWHRRDVQRPVILGAGERVQVTGIFNYGDRSIFLELTRWPAPPWDEDPARARIRFKADSGPEDPEAQDEEIQRLISRVLGPAGRAQGGAGSPARESALRQGLP